MADIEIATQTQDETFDLDAVVIGADSQAAAAPSVFRFLTIWTYLKTLTNTWAGVQTFSAGAVVENGLTVNGGITSDAGVYYSAGGTDVAVLDGGTGASTAADARTNLGLAIGTNVQAHSAVLDGTTASFTTADESKLDAIEASADVTDTANVTAAGALMDSEVASLAGIKTLTVPDTTTITAFGASLVDDVDAAAARATIGVDAAGTDNSTDVTLAGTPDYITLSGQVLTRNAVDLAADVTGNLPVTNLASGTGANATTFWRGDGSWVTPAGAGDMAAATYDPAGIVQQLVGLSATQTLTNKTLTSPVIDTPALGANSVDAITEIAAALKSGDDATLVTGTAGAAGNVAAWNADGDLIDGAIALDRNFVTNPGMRISQENGTSSGTASAYYAVDEWSHVHSQDGTLTAAQVAVATPGGSTHRYRMTVTINDTSIAAGQYAILRQRMEGAQVADFLFGTASARDMVVRFGCKWPAGTYTVTLQNAAADRSYVREFTTNGADQVFTVTFPGDTSGTWPTGAVHGMTLIFSYAVGSTFQTTADAWQAGNFYGTSSSANGLATAAAVFETFDVGAYLDPSSTGVAPTFVLSSIGADLMSCYRYFFRKELSGISVNLGMYATSATFKFNYSFPAVMRSTPSASNNQSGATLASLSAVTIGAQVPYEYGFTYTATDANANAYVVWVSGNYAQFSARM